MFRYFMSKIAQFPVTMWSAGILSFLLYFLQEISTEAVKTDIRNVQVIRLIDITTYIVKSKYKITLQNIGANPVENYAFELQDGPAFTTFTDGNNETLYYEADYKTNTTTYIVNLGRAILPKEQFKLKIRLIYPSKLVPATKFSKYDEEHSFMWKGNTVFYSKYYTISYRYMFVTDPSFNKNIETSIIHDSSVKNMLIFYAQNVKPYTYKEIILKFTSPIPVFHVKRLERSIFVSHFGKIMVEDQVVVENAGPKLLGPYFNTESDYWMHTHLPASAENIKFFDIIGNNSKTYLREYEGTKTLKFIPRFSIRQGGWRSTYTLQYYVPVYEYVFRNKTDYFLKIRALDHILNDVVIEDAEVKIVLPDGATIVSVVVPSGFKKENDSNIYTSLSILGRQTVNLKGAFLLEEHINDIIIKYYYSLFSSLAAPFFYYAFIRDCVLHHNFMDEVFRKILLL